VFGVLLAALAAGGPVGAQPLTPEVLRVLEAEARTGGFPASQPSPVDVARERRAAAGDSSPAPAPAPSPAPSRIEQDYGERAGQPLTQFGYDVFQGAVPQDELFTGAVGEDYRLGIGDEVVVTFLGQGSRSITTRVDREGRVILPELPPIPAAGRRFAEFRADLEDRTRAGRIGTEVFVSLGSVRMIRVVVAGEVVRAGVVQLTSLSTALEGLIAAGGVKKTGSLRRIHVNRGGERLALDLYDLLLEGSLTDQPTLMDGDQIVVPAIGPTAGVAGDVKRPGIFELLPEEGMPALETLVAWAGGPLRPTGNRFLHVSLDPRGRDLVQERADLATAWAREGDLVMVREGGTKLRGSVFLAGHVRAPGLRSLAAAPTVARLVPDLGAVREDPYLLFAVLSRVDPRTGARALTPINLARVLARGEDARLQADDVVVVPSLEDVRYLGSADVQAVLAGSPPAGARGVAPAGTPGGGLVEGLAAEGEGTGARAAGGPCRGLAELAALVATDQTARFANALRGLVAERAGVGPLAMPCPAVYDQYPELLRFLLEHAVALHGEVRTPGVYPVKVGTPLAEVVAYAGGFSREADQTNIELTRFALDTRQGLSETRRERVDLRSVSARTVALHPGDVVRFNPVLSDRDVGPVVLAGELVRPGVYNIRRGERLSEVIERAGGVTEQAYPYGAVFTRERIKRAEERDFQRYVRELLTATTTAAARQRTKAEGTGLVAAMESLIKTIQATPAVGRVVVEADPTVLQVRPEKDTILEAGDRLFMPKRPNFVTVVGEVLNPGAVAFESGANARDYIRLAGGLTLASDDSRAFLVLPDGSAQPLKVSGWNFEPRLIPPGSTVIVPRDPLPFDWMSFSLDVTAIFRDLAIAAASIAVIGDNN
jgi:protein involved in polysaccharide export with SLBB domain